MRRILPLLTLLLAAPPALGQETQSVVGQASSTITTGSRSIQASGSLIFPSAASSPSDQTIPALSGPTLTVTDNTGLQDGWSMTMVLATDFSSGTASFSRQHLMYWSPGGTGNLTRAEGQDIDGVGGPRELPYPAPGQRLSNVVQTVRAEHGYGYGTYVWTPSPEQFLLEIPGRTGPGTYTATLQFTVGPRL